MISLSHPPAYEAYRDNMCQLFIEVDATVGRAVYDTGMMYHPLLGQYNPYNPAQTSTYGDIRYLQHEYNKQLSRFNDWQYDRVEAKRSARNRVMRKLAAAEHDRRGLTTSRDFADVRAPNESYCQRLAKSRIATGLSISLALHKRKDDPSASFAALLHGSRVAHYGYRAVIQKYFPDEWLAYNNSYEFRRTAVYPVWCDEAWFTSKPIHVLHRVHVSKNNPALIAYTQSIDKLVRDVQTPCKPGKYLAKYFSDVLSEGEIRMWSERQQNAMKPATLHLVDNDIDTSHKSVLGDAWEWVYEHSPASCMKYNRSNRYLDNGLYGANHPVRAYARPGNNLGLAYIVAPETPDNAKHRELTSDKEYVTARTIVNVDEKTWLRVYANDDRQRTKLIDLLNKAGYSESSSCLRGVELNLREYNRGVICPYLDGNYDRVELCDGYMVVGDDGVDARKSSGLTDRKNIYTCPCCDDEYEDEEDLTYVECRGESICQSCLDERYRYAYGRRHHDYYDAVDCIYCETDGEWYLQDEASNHDVYECEESGNWYGIDDLCNTSRGRIYCDYCVSLDFEDCDGNSSAHKDDAFELPDGKYCHEDDRDRIMDEEYSEEEESEAA